MMSDTVNEETRIWRQSIEARFDEVALQRRAQSIQLDGMSRTVEQHGEAIDSVRGELADNTKITKKIEADTSEMIEMFRVSKSGFKVLGHIGAALKWAAGIVAAVAGAWVAFKGGGQ